MKENDNAYLLFDVEIVMTPPSAALWCWPTEKEEFERLLIVVYC